MPIYPHLRRLFVLMVVSLLLNPLALIDSQAVAVASSLINLLLTALAAYILSRIASESPRLTRAFAFQIATLVFLGLGILFMLLPPSDLLDTFSLMLILTGSIFSLLSDYNLFWGLDERIIQFGYAYPARRIRWCFYVPLLGALAGSIAQLATQLVEPGLIVQTVIQVIPLVLFSQFLRAVRDREADPLE